MNTANVIAAICSFFVPGLGQLVQGRWVKAIIYFVSTILFWFILLGWLPHLISIISAAKYKNK